MSAMRAFSASMSIVRTGVNVLSASIIFNFNRAKELIGRASKEYNLSRKMKNCFPLWITKTLHWLFPHITKWRLCLSFVPRKFFWRMWFLKEFSVCCETAIQENVLHSRRQLRELPLQWQNQQNPTHRYLLKNKSLQVKIQKKQKYEFVQ